MFNLTDSSGNQVFLEKKDTSLFTRIYNTPSCSSGLPKYYANWDANFWVVAPTPDSTYTVTLAYTKIQQQLHGLSSSNATSGTYLSQ